MAEHPGIFFQDGICGRRAKLFDGPDVWEVIDVIRGVDWEDDAALQEVTAWTSLSLCQIKAAIRYYRAYPDQIDDWVRRQEELVERLEQGWRPDQDPLTD